MHIFSPWNFLWLLPLGGGIVALWMLRLKRQEVAVASLFLWQSLLKETQANTPFQKLRRSLLLFLQLLAAFLLIFALAHPFVYGRGLAGRTIILVIDASASMSATDVRPTRLDAAKAAAEQFVDHEMHSTDVATVIVANNRPLAVQGFTTDPLRLKSAIEGISPTDTVADMSAALSLASSLGGGHTGTLVRIFSDGAYDRDQVRRIGGINLSTFDLKTTVIGSSSARNVAITAMDGRRDPVTGINEVFVTVQSLSGTILSGGTLSLYKDGHLIDARPLTLHGGSQSELFTTALLKPGGLVTARLEDLHDDLASDNEASVVLPAPHQRKILLVTSGNIFLEHGLNLDPDVVLEEVLPAQFATVGHRGAGYAMVVFDGALPAEPLPPGNYLIFTASSGQTPLIVTAQAVPNPTFIDQSHTHPVMRFVDLEGLSLRKAPRSTLAPWGQTLAEADSGPLIAAGETHGSRVVSVGFDLTDSDWPLRISFPIFLTNSIDWLTAHGSLGAVGTDTPTGTVAALTVPAGSPNVTILCPGGQTRVVSAPIDGGTVLFDRTDQAGIYHARVAGGGDYPFAVNLLNRDESTLTPQVQVALNHAGAPLPPTAITRVRSDLWVYVAAVALALLLLEWFVFHRRPEWRTS